ncbi:hypothetical protein CQW23_07995 [Capsicum baccatum]|uniref:O-methyltransferase C-terminal domain-containing protein n=1 Tax=Capsicum baccatum TaxID=33114 RepID=A0A2G2X7S2_CAPBA|nr:hypothetical protein CQW23_07995 [Capsicum baccatum]
MPLPNDLMACFFIQEEEGYSLTLTSCLLLKDETNLRMILVVQVMLDPTDDARFNCLFNEAMASDTRFIISAINEHCKGVFEGLKSLVDVGGGTGTVANAISIEFPESKFYVFDLPHIVEDLEGSKNLSYVGGDMFKFVPFVDAVLLKSYRTPLIVELLDQFNFWILHMSSTLLK